LRFAARLEKDRPEVADPYGFVTPLYDLAREYVSWASSTHARISLTE
jgi:hypothetical protein